MHIGFGISQTASGKARCGYYADALIKAMLERAPDHRYSILICRCRSGRDMHYGPRHLSRETARQCWAGNEVESSLGNPAAVHANNFWCPTQLASSRLIYTFYDMAFAVGPAWTTEANRVGCFDEGRRCGAPTLTSNSIRFQ